MNVQSLLALPVTLAPVAFFLLSGTIEAQTVTWDAGVNSTWDTSTANWTGGTYSNGNDAQFLGTGSGTVTLTGSISPGSLLVASSNDYTFTGTGIASTGNIDKTGSGTLELTATGNTATTINAAGGNLILSGTSTTTATDINVANSGISGGGSGTLTIQDSATLSASGNFLVGNRTGKNGTVNQTGGTVNLTSSETNAIRVGHWSNLTGTYSISGGTLNVLNTSFQAGWDSTGILNVNGGTANLKGLGLGMGNSPSRKGTLNLGGGTLNIGSSGIYQEINGTVNLNSGTLGSLADWSSGLDMNLNGTVRVNTSGGNITLNGNLAGEGTLNKTDSGNLTLNGGTNTAASINAAGGNLILAGTSNTTVSGDMFVSRSDITGGGSGTLTVQDSATLNVDGQFAVGRQNWTDGAVNQTGGTVNLNGAATIGQWSVLTGTYTISDGTLNVQNENLTLGWDGTGVLNVNGGTVNAKGLRLGHGNHSQRSGIVNLEGGTLNVGANGIARETNSALNFNNGTLGAQADWSTNMNIQVGDSVDDHLQVDTTGGNISLNGNLSGSGALTKVGSGKLVLSGTNTQTGITTVDAGELQLDGSQTGGIIVNVGGILSGSGSINGALTLKGQLSPGNSPGTLSTGSQTWQNGASLLWEVNNSAGTPGNSWDLLDIDGTLSLDSLTAGGFSIDITSLNLSDEAGDAEGFDPEGGIYTFQIATTTGGITGFDADKIVLDSSGFTNSDGAPWDWNVYVDGNDLYLSTSSSSAVPEPSTLGFISISSLGLCLRRRRAS